MKKIILLILLCVFLPVAGIAVEISGQGGGTGTSFSVTDITGQTDDTTPATTATAVLAQGGSLIESTLAQIATAINASGTHTGLTTLNALAFSTAQAITLSSDAAAGVTASKIVVTSESSTSDTLKEITCTGTCPSILFVFPAAGHTITITDTASSTINITSGSNITIVSTGQPFAVFTYDYLASKYLNVTSPDKLNISALDMTAGTSSIPQPLAATASIPATCTQGSKWQDSTTGIDYSCTATNTWTALVNVSATQTLTGKTYDVDGTGNDLKSWGYIVLTHPHLCAAGAPMQTTSTANTYGQCKFGNATDKATNYAEYYLVVPPDILTAVDLTGTFKIKLGGADTGDHEYEISFDSVANSAAYAGSLGDAISLAFTADVSGADGDVETAGETTLTGWKAAMTAGQLFVIRVARDGDHANDGSTVDSYSGPLIIKYKITQ